MAQDISQMSIGELKILAYDLGLQYSSVQQDLNTVNNRITQLANEIVPVVPTEEVVPKPKKEKKNAT